MDCATKRPRTQILLFLLPCPHTASRPQCVPSPAHNGNGIADALSKMKALNQAPELQRAQGPQRLSGSKGLTLPAPHCHEA
jgi:hypothetical protein